MRHSTPYFQQQLKQIVNCRNYVLFSIRSSDDICRIFRPKYEVHAQIFVVKHFSPQKNNAFMIDTPFAMSSFSCSALLRSLPKCNKSTRLLRLFSSFFRYCASVFFLQPIPFLLQSRTYSRVSFTPRTATWNAAPFHPATASATFP